MSSGRIVITGGAGFLGSNLCERYLQQGWDVVCIDNESSGLSKNVAPLLAHAQFTYLKQDIVRDFRVEGPVDVVLHMASLASPPFYKNFPLETLLVGSTGTYHCLNLAQEKSARIVFASTSEVYGDPAVSPQPEGYWGNVNPIGPRSMYDESKRYGEALVTAHRKIRGTNTGIVRIFNTYGPGMRPDDGRVVTAFLTQLLRSKPLNIHGDGLQTRSFCYVDDLVRGIMLMADSDHSGPINLGNPHGEMSIRELAERLSALFGREFIVGPPAPPQDENDPKRRCPDISLARDVLGWEPVTPFEDGMRATRDWLRSQLNLDA